MELIGKAATVEEDERREGKWKKGRHAMHADRVGGWGVCGRGHAPIAPMGLVASIADKWHDNASIKHDMLSLYCLPLCHALPPFPFLS